MTAMAPSAIYQTAVSAGFDPQQAVTMTAIALAESSGNTSIVSPPNNNGTVDRGLWQINSSHSQYDPTRLTTDPGYNGTAAKAIFDSQGLGAWSTYSNGAYKKYLGEAQSAAAGGGTAATPSATGAAPAEMSTADKLNAVSGLAAGAAPDTTPSAPNTTPAAPGSSTASNPTGDTSTPTAPAAAPTTPQTPVGPAATAIHAAMSALGKPYVWGGNSLSSGVDCSGLIQQAYKAAGIDLPRVSNAQVNSGQPVAPQDMQPGDILGYVYNQSLGGGATHVALYIGGGKMIEALHTGAPVAIVDVRPPDFVTRPTVGGAMSASAASGGIGAAVASNQATAGSGTPTPTSTPQTTPIDSGQLTSLPGGIQLGQR